VHIVLTTIPAGVLLTMIPDAGSGTAPAPHSTSTIPRAALAAEVARLERDRPRWVWADSTAWYPALLAAGVRVERCVDLRLCHTILRGSLFTADSALANSPRGPWDSAFVEPRESRVRDEDTLFAFGDEHSDSLRKEPASGVTGASQITDPVAEFLSQREAVAGAAEPGRIGLLLAAESAGALIACEMKFGGLPWHAGVHERLLESLLGPRPAQGERPARMDALLEQMRVALDQRDVNPDSPNDLLRALGRAGIHATSTRSWELKEITHPVIAPLLEYKKLARLVSANGWSWLESWVADGRFRPDYVPGGAATGRWGANGGGALQLPKQIRAAVVADPGWKLVVADAAQLEPRILAALSADRRMAEAGRGDLYEGIVASGAVATRAEAKVAMLGAMYGATTGESGRLMPALTRAFPQAIAMVEAAARAGERGEKVSTRLGRGSHVPSQAWRDIQGAAYGEGATEGDTRRARAQARAWGRFTRNFIVQGTAAEWALSWMAGVRNELWKLSRGAFTERPHLVFFLHDEIIVHTPVHLTERVVEIVRESAAGAGRLVFGALPVDFPVTAVDVDNYGQAK
jgi:DNA polymerase-1